MEEIDGPGGDLEEVFEANKLTFTRGGPVKMSATTHLQYERSDNYGWTVGNSCNLVSERGVTAKKWGVQRLTWTGYYRNLYCKLSWVI